MSAACRTAPGPVRSEAREQVLSLVDVDSMVFDAVVRGQLEGSDDAYPYRLTRFRYDSSPYRANSGYPDLLTGVEGTAPALSFPRESQSESELNYLIDTRKKILRTNGVPEGRAVFYSQCAGAGVPAPPPPRRPRGRSARRVPAPNVHAGCPRVVEVFLTVGLPIHGQPPGLSNSRDTRERAVRLDGEVWTVLVDETTVGPGGWRQSQYAWVFERNRSGGLELAHTILIAVSQ
ncbi:MAG TPA: hypothetical protein VFS56_00865 [Gemmatimonadaceae bacterium]|nr:hypothetical protein [Gemmatimonadaceae bacterium]